ncbi:family 20 glycosylhydrolase [Arthrobacter alpinus]|uniref:family 20 glycosylhydrolase n=1 Tax=Arthrobacter alpinus TaxID=656366 RepID=UPI000ABCCEFC|nr:family 20 glycosylhydrolase [Arthrobacter alpinus]
MTETSLFPRPRKVETIGGAGAAANTSISVTQDATLASQGYRLDYSDKGILLAFSDAAGLRYGMQTLDQLRAQPRQQQVAVHIEDWPDFTHRGFMLDVSRDRVPTRASLARLVKILDLARINHLEIYTEHTFAYRGHEKVWRDASPLTPQDVRWLDDLCASHGIELVPNQNTFGHWERWLAIEQYLPRAENQSGIQIGNEFLAPSTLAPTSDNAAFVTELLEELTPNFRSNRLNIGADETWELGTGVSKSRAEKEGLATVYLDYVTEVMAPWVERDYTVEFWADILGTYPELMSRIPKGTMPIVWHYDSPTLVQDTIANMGEEEWTQLAAHGYGPENLTKDFTDRAKALVAAGAPFWVAPGTSTWLSILGRLQNAKENMIDAAELGITQQSTGYLNTAWGITACSIRQ